MDPATILFGLGVGVLVGVTGMGGGSLMTPLLILVVGVKPVVAVGTDLAYGAVTKTVCPAPGSAFVLTKQRRTLRLVTVPLRGVSSLIPKAQGSETFSLPS